MFDNVDKLDKVILTVSLPVRLAQSFIEFNQLYILPTMRNVRNWWSVGFVYLGIVQETEINLRSGEHIRFRKENVNELISKMRALDLPVEIRKKLRISTANNKATLYFGDKKLSVGLESLTAVAQEFYNKPHKNMDVTDRVVVDLGAYFGETSIYYAIEGKAKKAYAYELFPFICKKAQENVRMNALGSKIKMFNEGIGGKAGSMMISGGESSFSKTNAKHHKDKVMVRILSLDQVVRKFKITNGALKVDIEGAEYNIFKHASPETLHSFDIIHIEYHYGYKNLVERLRKEGFKVKYTRPRINLKGFGKPMLNGDILAIK